MGRRLRFRFSAGTRHVTGTPFFDFRFSDGLSGQTGTKPEFLYDLTRFVNQIARDFTPPVCS